MTYPVTAIGTRLTADFLNSMLPITARKTGTTSRASTIVPAADPDLFLAVEANAVYEFRLIAYYIALNGANGGISIAFTVPTGATGAISFGAHDGGASTASFNQDQQGGTGTITATVNMAGSTSPNVNASVLQGLLVTSSTSGNFTVTWSQLTTGAGSATATVMQANSYLTAKRIA